MKSIECLISGRIIIHGVPSRNVYIWDENRIINVNDEDVPDILSKKQVQGGCCGTVKQEIQIFRLNE